MRTELLTLALACVAVACGSDGQGTSAAARDTASSGMTGRGTTEAELVVSDMVAAYNKHDASAAAAAYAPDVRFYHFPDQLFLEGRDAVRTRFQRAFADGPTVKVEVSPRLVHGRFVVDRENIIGLRGGKTAVALWIYEVQNGQIARAWRLPD